METYNFTGLPNSARTIYHQLVERGPSTHKDLILTTGMPARTIRFGLERLLEHAAVRKRPSFEDTRQFYYEAVVRFG